VVKRVQTTTWVESNDGGALLSPVVALSQPCYKVKCDVIDVIEPPVRRRCGDKCVAGQCHPAEKL
jgi:hypothetical protein